MELKKRIKEEYASRCGFSSFEKLMESKGDFDESMVDDIIDHSMSDVINELYIRLFKKDTMSMKINSIIYEFEKELNQWN